MGQESLLMSDQSQTLQMGAAVEGQEGSEKFRDLGSGYDSTTNYLYNQWKPLEFFWS